MEGIAHYFDKPGIEIDSTVVGRMSGIEFARGIKAHIAQNRELIEKIQGSR